jgi:hypothetical protein
VKSWRLVVCLLCIVFPSFAADVQPALTESEKAALVSAIEDEIYDYGLQQNFRSVGKALTADEFEIPLFVTKESHGSSHYVIYRLLPFGEMYRLVTVGPDGLVRLFRNPRSGFPPDAPAMQTVYYDDDLICSLKHEALRLSFVVEMTPSKQRIQEAVERQKKRYGFSNLAEKETRKKARHGAE